MYNLGYIDTISHDKCGGIRAPHSLGLEVPGYLSLHLGVLYSSQQLIPVCFLLLHHLTTST